MEIDIPWNQVFMTIIAVAVLYTMGQLAAWSIAPWDNVYTVILLILAGFGFLSAGTAYGEARAYRAIYRQMEIAVAAEEAKKPTA